MLNQLSQPGSPPHTLFRTTRKLTWQSGERWTAPGHSRLEREANAVSATMNVDHEVNLLVEEIHRLGSKNADGKLSVKFGVLFQDDKCANLFEALVGTLKAAKRRKVVTYPGELLLQGVHDDVDIVLLQD
uniref:Costars family protein ABRACL n=7 Tax=Felidae TaxID=9681 RepID=A0ABI7X2B7_FELCA